MTAHPAIAAVPKTGTPSRPLLQNLLVTRVAYIVGAGENPQDFDPRGENGDVVTRVIGYNGSWFWYDESDTTTGHDGVTCIVTTATGGRYKVFGTDLLITHVLSKSVTGPPSSPPPADGDAYIVPPAATGAWAGHTNEIAVWVASRSEWFFIAPKPGWAVTIPSGTRDQVFRYDSIQATWLAGDGAIPTADSIPLSALLGLAASYTLRVENQTTYAPPGSRITNATPSMPKGGTASNINDNSDSTTATTSALGDLSAQPVGNRIIARLTFVAATDLICIEARGIYGSAASSTDAMGLYYSTDGGNNWQQAGSGFTISTTSLQAIKRTGTFTGVTDVAVVTEAKNWGTNTNTLAGLNAFTSTVDASVGDSYIIPSDGIGIFAGQTNKVAICESNDSFTFYTPQAGDEAWDKSINARLRFNGTNWVAAAGVWIEHAKSYVQDSSGLGAAGGSGHYTYSPTSPPSTSQRARQLDAINYTAKAVGALLQFHYSAAITGVSKSFVIELENLPYVIGLFRDNETSAIAWDLVGFVYEIQDSASVTIETVGDLRFIRATFDVTANDLNTHTYKIYIFPAGDRSFEYMPSTVTHRLLYVLEKEL